MTKDQIDAVLDRVHSWPRERQEDAARVLLAMEAEGTELYALSAEERADLKDALAEVARGELASKSGPPDSPPIRVQSEPSIHMVFLLQTRPRRTGGLRRLS
jgi:hypothetical protein